VAEIEAERRPQSNFPSLKVRPFGLAIVEETQVTYIAKPGYPTRTPANLRPRSRCQGLEVALLLSLGTGLTGCAVVAVADAAVSVGATAVKAGAAVVGAAVDVTSAGVRAATGSAKKQ